MVNVAQSDIRNQLLKALAPCDYAHIAPYLRACTFRRGDTIWLSGARITDVYFPERAVASMSEVFSGEERCMVGLVGREGMLGWPVLLNCANSPHEVVCRFVAVSGFRIDAACLVWAAKASSSLEHILLRYIHTFTVQMSRTIVSAAADSIGNRVARMILMALDRIGGSEFAVTHQELADLLNVRRASVTDALHILESHGAISSRRNRIIIRDRAMMQVMTERSYGTAELYYNELIAPMPASRLL
jgi:CRP-like cAMP-binding protein